MWCVVKRRNCFVRKVRLFFFNTKHLLKLTCLLYFAGINISELLAYVSVTKIVMHMKHDIETNDNEKNLFFTAEKYLK